MFYERFCRIPLGNRTLFLTADHDRILEIGFRVPSAMGLLRNDRHPLLCETAKQIEDYLSGKRTDLTFDINTDFLPFFRSVYAAVCAVPYGSHCSSREIAALSGYPHNQEAVERLCRCNPLYLRIPTHRVDTESLPLSETDRMLRELERRFVAP